MTWGSAIPARQEEIFRTSSHVALELNRIRSLTPSIGNRDKVREQIKQKRRRRKRLEKN